MWWLQPGVEFDHASVIGYQPAKAQELSEAILGFDNIVYEAHSTDYQTETELSNLVDDHFAILKVGPGLTYAAREALFALSYIEQEWITDRPLSNLRQVLDERMLEHPENWAKYYPGSDEEQAFARKYSFSDRSRYYWADPEIDRSGAQRRADALSGLAERALRGGDLPVEGGRRPQVAITADLATLARRDGAPAARLDHSGPVSAATARQLACDADVHRIITDGESDVLDAGRAQRTVSRAQRRALAARDGGCVGCDAPPGWTDAHHVVFWDDGGATDMDNLVLLCRSCHTSVHHRGWRVTIHPDTGRRRLRRPARARAPAAREQAAPDRTGAARDGDVGVHSGTARHVNAAPPRSTSARSMSARSTSANRRDGPARSVADVPTAGVPTAGASRRRASRRRASRRRASRRRALIQARSRS